MLKTIEIDGKKVRFESKGSTPLRYKKQFGADFLADILKLGALGNLNKNEILESMSALDTEVFYNIVWVLAKTAENEIPEPFEWFDTFDTFPIIEIIPELQELIMASLQSKKK